MDTNCFFPKGFRNAMQKAGKRGGVNPRIRVGLRAKRFVW